MTHQFNYKDALAASEKVTWRVEDIIGGERKLDFSKPFLPDSLARVSDMTFLDREEQITLNQIRGHGYLCMFGLVEEFILPFVLDHVQPTLHGDDHQVRAFLNFAAEEAKHIHLFNRFREEFQKGFGTPCDFVGPADEISKAVLAHHPLAVALVTLGIEWMTQKHFTESVRDNQTLDPQFKSMLKHHWMEELQHAQLDTLMVEAIAARCTPEEIDQAVEDYMKIGGMVDGALQQQTEFDLDAFERATGRTLTQTEQDVFRGVQHQAMRWTFLGSGMTHPQFVASVGKLGDGVKQTFANVAPNFC